MHFRMALIQMSVIGGNKSKNLAKAQKMIAEAASKGSHLVVLPEAMDLGWTHPSSKDEAEAIPGGYPYQSLSKAASLNNVYVCAGLTERSGEQIFNSAVIIDKNGKLLSLHRKINELDIGHPYYAQGDRLSVVHTELGTLGLMICADGFAENQVLSRSLCYMGADIILSPCAWAVPAEYDNEKQPYGDTWRNAYLPVARDFQVWIVGVSNVGTIEAGPWAGQKCIGCSLVVGPGGNQVIQGPYGVDAETIIYLDIKPERRPVRGCDWSKYLKSKPIDKQSH